MEWPFLTTRCALILTSLFYILHASFYFITAVILEPFDLLVLSCINSVWSRVQRHCCFLQMVHIIIVYFALSYKFNNFFFFFLPKY